MLTFQGLSFDLSGRSSGWDECRPNRLETGAQLLVRRCIYYQVRIPVIHAFGQIFDRMFGSRLLSVSSKKRPRLLTANRTSVRLPRLSTVCHDPACAGCITGCIKCKPGGHRKWPSVKIAAKVPCSATTDRGPKRQLVAAGTSIFRRSKSWRTVATSPSVFAPHASSHWPRRKIVWVRS